MKFLFTSYIEGYIGSNLPVKLQVVSQVVDVIKLNSHCFAFCAGPGIEINDF